MNRKKSFKTKKNVNYYSQTFSAYHMSLFPECVLSNLTYGSRKKKFFS